MPNLVKDDAYEIAKKLRRKLPTKPGREKFSITETNGRKHILITVSYRGRMIAEYGIKHSPDRNAGHNWIPEQLHLTQRQGFDLAKCTLSVDGFIDILIENGQIPGESQEANYDGPQ